MVTQSDREPFLRRAETIDALRRLSSKQHLVIYCGAGVTADRTGLSWGGLVDGVFRSLEDDPTRDDQLDAVVRRFLLDANMADRQKASIVAAASGASDENAFLEPILQELLYVKNGWRQGYLLKNVARLALMLASYGRRVSILTTNYDDYIEGALIDELATLDSELGAGVVGAGLRVDVLGGSASVVREHAAGAAQVEVVYIHGKKPNGKPAAGRIAFSEESYSLTRQQEVDFLVGQFHAGAALLIVGSSFNDEPLIEALMRTRPANADRVGLLTMPSAPLLDREGYAAAVALRGHHLATTILSPESYAQVAHFVEELRIHASLYEFELDESYEEIFSYPARLTSWWQEWQRSPWSQEHQQHFDLLRETQADLRQFFDLNGIERSEEILRVELWVRLDPSVSRENRHLTLFANSTGPLMVEQDLRREPIDPESTIAAVRAFRAGSPGTYSLEDLGYNGQASRWRGFLAVPIFFEPEHDGISLEDGEDTSTILLGGSVPVAVACLTSTLPLTGDEVASFADPALKNEHYVEMLAHLIGVGRAIASPKYAEGIAGDKDVDGS